MECKEFYYYFHYPKWNIYDHFFKQRAFLCQGLGSIAYYWHCSRIDRISLAGPIRLEMKQWHEQHLIFIKYHIVKTGVLSKMDPRNICLSSQKLYLLILLCYFSFVPIKITVCFCFFRLTTVVWAPVSRHALYHFSWFDISSEACDTGFGTRVYVAQNLVLLESAFRLCS